ncbi:uncharacterized protein J4E79_004159 [Alternaria viburni]|uniref:uncharacterized protein n=1 Tax=Alternaria viburni TaxID=566460 RepID=UPI0020C40E23|nr:uncharacterized protein J4E79_004159 [Alternaria viburni]KAI4662848.1 hypothetical protein J4E79_004159 [Alternaria viburni]
MAHQIQTWHPAKTFVKNMWRAMYRLYERDQVIYDSDIEEHINARMLRFYLYNVESVLEWQIGDEESEHEVSGDEPSDDEASDVEDDDDDMSMADSTE